MSQWKYGNFEAEVDFTDADFLDTLEVAKQRMDEQIKNVPKVGKVTDIIRAQIACFDAFFDELFGLGAGEQIRDGRMSLEVSLSSVEAMYKFYQEEDKRTGDVFSKYNVKNNGNRQQQRYDKYKGKNNNHR
ncbi:MAG: DUF6673 family protein [Lachnospiraceae bacterium]